MNRLNISVVFAGSVLGLLIPATHADEKLSNETLEQIPKVSPLPIETGQVESQPKLTPRPEPTEAELQTTAVQTGPWFCYQYKTWQFQGQDTPCDPTDDYWYWWTNRHDEDDCDAYTGGIYPAHGSESFQNCPTDGSGCGKPSVCCSTGTAFFPGMKDKNYVLQQNDPPKFQDPTCLKKAYSEDYQPKWGPDQEEFQKPQFIQIKTGEKIRYAKVFFVKISLGKDPQTNVEKSRLYSLGIEVEKNEKVYRQVVCTANKGFPCQFQGNVLDFMVTTFLTTK